jgi:predicted AAA+ superfamily ATPase
VSILTQLGNNSVTHYRRALQPAIEAALFKGKLVIHHGARQVCKTTLVQEILRQHPAPSLYLNCDEPDIREALTGRKVEFHLFPLSVAELLTQETPLEARRLLDERLRYGPYPGVMSSDDPAGAIREIASSYLYRDVLEYQVVPSPETLRRLLQASGRGRAVGELFHQRAAQIQPQSPARCECLLLAHQ